jgi:uncharacterized MnhB-related membrane protein
LNGFIILFTMAAISLVALYALVQKSLVQSVVLYLGVGLGSVVLFFLFNAPDVALTEAVIGAGISTIVLMIGIARMHREKI